jgi:HEAT repeat protein
LHELQYSRDKYHPNPFARTSEAIHADLDAIGPEAVPALIEALKDVGEPEPWTRISAADELAKRKDRRAVKQLIACLRENPCRVPEAASALGAIGDASALDALFECVNRNDLELLQRSLGAIGMIGDRKAVDPLLALLKGPVPRNIDVASYHSALAIALGMLGDRRALAPLLAVLNEPAIIEPANLSARGAVIGGLGSLGDPGAFDTVLHVLVNQQENMSVRALAARAIGRLDRSRAVEPLLTLLKSPVPRDANELTTSAAVALGKTKERRAVQPLIALLDEPAMLQPGGDASRAEVVRALGQIGDVRAFDVIVQIVQSQESDFLRGAAAEALGRLGDPRAVQVLRKATNDASPHVQAMAKKALAHLQTGN